MDVARRELGFAEMILRKGRPKKKAASQAVVLKKSEVEKKLLFEMEMRSAAQRLLTACSNPQQRLDAAKTILTSNSRTYALMSALQREHVREVEDAHGLTDIKNSDELLRAEMLDTASLAHVTISNITIPLKWCRIDPARYKADCWKYQVFCVVRSGIQVMDSKAFCKVDILLENITFQDSFILKDLSPDFTIHFEFYYAQNDENTKSKKSKKGDSQDASTPVFAIGASASLTLAHCNIWQQKQALKPGNIGAPAHITAPSTLPDLPPLPVLNFYRSDIDVVPHFTLSPSKEGFLDVQHMAGGMPHWERCWCVLQGMYLKVWKQPEEQFVCEPTQTIEINEHMLLDHTSRSSVQRPHSVHISYSKSPYTDHFLSTDTKEERVLWEIALHKAMINTSTWHPNKLSSTQNLGTSPSPLKLAPPKPPRPDHAPQFSYTPGAPCLPAYRAQYEAANRGSRKERWADGEVCKTPKQRSKSVERKKTTPGFSADQRSRAKTCSKPSRRRSRSVDLSPLRARAMLGSDTPVRSAITRDIATRDMTSCSKPRDRVSDATYVSMHKFSRVPVPASTKPSRPAPRPPSLSKMPSREGRSPRPLSAINRAAQQTGDYMAGSRRKSPRLQLQVDFGQDPRKKKGRAPAVPADTTTPAASHSQIRKTSRSKKSPAPSPHKTCSTPPRKTTSAPTPPRKTPRQSQGGTNNLNSPNRSGKKKAGLLNVINESCGELSPSIDKISNSTSSIPSTSFDFEGMIDDAFGSLYQEGTLLSVDTADVTPSFHAHLTPKRGQKVARNTPLTSTMRDNAAPFTPPHLTNIFGKEFRGGGGKITPILEEEKITPILEEKRGGEESDQARRGESLLAGYFDTSSSTIHTGSASTTADSSSDKENSTYSINTTPTDTPSSTTTDTCSPVNTTPTDTGSPVKRNTGSSTTTAKRRSPAPPRSQAPAKRRSVSPTRSPAVALPYTSPNKTRGVKGALQDGSNAPPAVANKPKPRFQVVKGKLVPF